MMVGLHISISDITYIFTPSMHVRFELYLPVFRSRLTTNKNSISIGVERLMMHSEMAGNN